MANVLSILIVLPFAVAVRLFAAGVLLAARLALAQWHELTWAQRLRLLVKVAGLGAFAAAICQFAVYLVLIAACGGSAQDGKAEGGRYYVGSHGRYTEVSETKWQILRFHEGLAFGIGVTGTVGFGVCLLLGHYEQRQARRAKLQPLSVIALLQPGEAPGDLDAAADRPAVPSGPAVRFPVATAIAALLLMLVLDAAALVLLVADIMRFFQSLMVLWLIAAPCWLVAMFFSETDSRLVKSLTAVAFVGTTAFVAGPVMAFGCAAIAALQQDLVVAILVLIPVSLLTFGFQFLFAMPAAESILAIFT